MLRLLLSHSAAALRAGAADDGAAAVQVLPTSPDLPLSLRTSPDLPRPRPVQVLPYRTIPMLARDRQIDRIGIDPLAVRSTALPDWWSFDRFRWHVIACMLEGPDDETQARPAPLSLIAPPRTCATTRAEYLPDLIGCGAEVGRP